MNTKSYSVRYYCDGEVTCIRYTMPENASNEEIIRQGAGLLFLHDCCPGETFCCYLGEDRNLPIVTDAEPHYYYQDSGRLWPPSDEVQTIFV